MDEDHLWIDTVSNPNNIWQVGSPQKSVFTNAYSSPNVIVTDSIDSYPTNDTSTFIVTNAAFGSAPNGTHTFQLQGQYYVNSDTLTDFGMIEFSPDKGLTWVNLLNDTVGNWFWENERAVLSGNSNGWKDFSVDLTELADYFVIDYDDTVLYKFTFISDANQTNKDGLMFDNLFFQDDVSGLEEFDFNLIESKSYPNPVVNEITISFSNDQISTFEVFIYDVLGKQIYKSETTSDNVQISLQSLNNGTYYYKLVDKKNKEYTLGKFVKL